MGLNDVMRRMGKFASDNSPAILTGLAVVGTLTTAYLTGKACFKAAQILDDHDNLVIREEEEPLEPREKVRVLWKLYIPAASSAVTTVAFIIAANRIGTRRAAAMAAAYAIAERGFEEYREKIIEKLGDRKEQAARDEIAQDRVTNYPPCEEIDLPETGMSVLCCDLFTGRYFLSDMESLRRAQNDVNYQVNNDYYASLTDFYDAIGLPKTSMSDDFGWNSDRLLDLEFSTAMTPSGRPCLTFTFKVMPIRGYSRLQ